MAYHRGKRTGSASVQQIRPFDLLLVDNRHKQVRMDNQEGPMKAGRSHAEYGKRMLVDLNRTAHNAAIVLKMSVPKAVAEDDVRSAVGTMLIGGVEEVSKIGLNP